MPSSAPPRLMRPAALRSIPELSASSTTIVATPIAMPSAVRTVRAACRRRSTRIRCHIGRTGPYATGAGGASAIGRDGIRVCADDGPAPRVHTVGGWSCAHTPSPASSATAARRARRSPRCSSTSRRSGRSSSRCRGAASRWATRSPGRSARRSTSCSCARSALRAIPSSGMGAVAEGGVRVLDAAMVRDLLVSAEELETAIARANAELDGALAAPPAGRRSARRRRADRHRRGRRPGDRGHRDRRGPRAARPWRGAHRRRGPGGRAGERRAAARARRRGRLRAGAADPAGRGRVVPGLQPDERRRRCGELLEASRAAPGAAAGDPADDPDPVEEAARIPIGGGAAIEADLVVPPGAARPGDLRPRQRQQPAQLPQSPRRRAAPAQRARHAPARPAHARGGARPAQRLRHRPARRPPARPRRRGPPSTRRRGALAGRVLRRQHRWRRRARGGGAARRHRPRRGLARRAPGSRRHRSWARSARRCC